MSTATRANEGMVGVAVQSAEGTAAGTATYDHPIYSGLPKVNQTITPLEPSSTDELVPGHVKETQWWELDMVMPGLIKSLGAYLKPFMGSLATSGTTNLTHTFTRTATPGFVTMFARAPGTAYRKFADGSIESLVFDFAAGQILKVNVKGRGYTPSDLASAYTVTTTETLVTAGPYLSYIGATMKLDQAATPATTTVGNIRSGTVELTRGVELIQIDGLNPEITSYGKFSVAVSLDTIWADYTAFKSTFYGSTTGTTSSQVVVYGSLDFLFGIGPSSDANKSLQIQLPNVILTVPEPPDVDPAAGPLAVSIVGLVDKPSSGEMVTLILKNTVASY